MNEIPISPDIWNLAHAILTEKQLAVLELREQHGFSWNQLAVNFNCTRANVREIHRAASKNLLDELERQRTETASG
jgi:transcriptional regulator